MESMGSIKEWWLAGWAFSMTDPSHLYINSAQTTMRPEMITQIIRKQFFCVTNVRAIGKLIPRQLICVIGTFTESTL